MWLLGEGWKGGQVDLNEASRSDFGAPGKNESIVCPNHVISFFLKQRVLDQILAL